MEGLRWRVCYDTESNDLRACQLAEDHPDQWKDFDGVHTRCIPNVDFDTEEEATIAIESIYTWLGVSVINHGSGESE